MKRFNMILTAAALTLATACTDTEKVLPVTANAELRYEQNTTDPNVNYDDQKDIRYTDVSVEQGPREAADFNGTLTDNGTANESRHDGQSTTQSDLTPSDIQVNQGPKDAASYNGGTANVSRQSDTEQFGELLPASFLDCGTFIRQTNGQLFEVLNANEIPAAYRESGSQVTFSYEGDLDIYGPCQLGSAIKLTAISFSTGNTTGTHDAKDPQSGTH